MNEQLANTAMPAAGSASNCDVTEEWLGRVVVLSTSGTIDMLSAPRLQQAINAALAQNPTGLVVDFTEVEFLASAGMGVLVITHDEKPPSVDFCLVADGPATSRPLKLVGIADIVQMYATRDEALAALSA